MIASLWRHSALDVQTPHRRWRYNSTFRRINLSSNTPTDALATMAASPSSRVFSAYRRLFRARARLFQGDGEALQESGRAIRQQFMQNRAAPTSGEHFEGLLGMVDEAEDMLLTGFVQGRLNDNGHYHVAIKPEHTGDAQNTAAVPQLEPVTEDTVQRMKGVQVNVTSCTNKQGGDSKK
jgi:hypothetical protein